MTMLCFSYFMFIVKREMKGQTMLNVNGMKNYNRKVAKRKYVIKFILDNN